MLRKAPRLVGLALTLCLVLVTMLASTLYSRSMRLKMWTADLPADHLPSTHPEVLQALRTTYLLPPSTLPYNLSRGPAYLATAQGGSWSFINHYLTRMFNGERSGFFVEAGALDGQQLSNTLWLEQELAWTGLLIEPNPYSFQNLRHKHRKAWTSNSCISSDTFTKRSVHVAKDLRPGYAQSRWFIRGSSYELGISMMDKLPLDLQLFHNSGDETYLMAYCFPLHSYLLALNVTTIDMLSLDTQGSEVGILKSIPWKKLEIRVVVVEMTDVDTYQAELVEFMTGNGYVLVDRYLDYIFVTSGDSAHSHLMSHSDWNLAPRE